MTTHQLLREHAQAIVEAGVAAVRADALVQRQLRLEGDTLVINGQRMGLHPEGRCWVVGAGKAAAHMAAALEQLLGERLSGGAVVVKYGHGLPLSRIDCLEAGHPVPDAAGLVATERIVRIVESLDARDTLIVVLTGGASALLADLPPGAVLSELQQLTDSLLRAGADITALNAVRKHLSLVKGGHLLRRAQPARVLTLAVSDVVGDPLDVIGSGPTVADSSTYAQALAVLARYGITAPRALHQWLEDGARGQHPETLKHTEHLAPHATVLLGTNAHALQAAAQAARALGYTPHISAEPLEGPAEAAAAHIVQSLRGSRPGRVAWLWGGETTVRVTGTGRGGRSQHLALAALLQLSAEDRLCLLAAGTDGSDGPTDAAGAWADAAARTYATELGLDLAQALSQCDSYQAHAQLGTLYRSGPTGTNVMDVVVGLLPE